MESKVFSNASISSRKQQVLDFAKYDVQLDAALNELHMLSTIPKSRLEYLKSKGCSSTQVNKKTQSNSPSLPLCVVQMNPDFVTKFSVSKDSASTPDGSLSDESLKTELILKAKVKQKFQRRENNLTPYCWSQRKFQRRLNNFTPYCPRKRLDRFVKPVESSLSDITEERSSLLIIPHQDCGNKSNPSSPVKSQNSSKSVACSIFRSRSLDDLEISKLNLEDNVDQACYGDLDTVSQRISKLRVS